MSKALQRSNTKPQQTDGNPNEFDNVGGDHLASNEHHYALSSKPCTHERSKEARTAFTSRIESESYAKTSLKELYRSVEVITTPGRAGHSRLDSSSSKAPPSGTTLYEALLEIKRLKEENEALRMEVKRIGPLDTVNETLRAENATLRENNDAFQVKEEAYKHEIEKWQARAFKCKEKYRDYRAKVKRSILNNQLDALETPARGFLSSTPYRQGGNESDEEERGRDLEHGLRYWESFQNSVRLKRSAIRRPLTVSAADVTNAHVLGGTSALRKSRHPQPQFHIVDPLTPSKPARSRRASPSPTKTPARTARGASPEKTPWRI